MFLRSATFESGSSKSKVVAMGSEDESESVAATTIIRAPEKQSKRNRKGLKANSEMEARSRLNHRLIPA